MRISDWSSDVCSSDLGPHILAGAAQLRIAEETAILDRGIDPGKVLIHHPAGADVHVPDLRIAHLAIGQADEAALALDPRVRALCQQALPGRTSDERRVRKEVWISV